MSYYGQGDYYGQGGLGSLLKGIGKAAVGGIGGFLTGGPAGAVSGVVRSIAPQPRAPQLMIPPMQVNPRAMLPGGDPFVTFGRKRRKMNYANSRALTRANRRVDGFVRMARRSLKHTGYKIVSKSASKGRRVSVSEHGPGSVHVRG